jgi:translation initiation factor 1
MTRSRLVYSTDGGGVRSSPPVPSRAPASAPRQSSRVPPVIPRDGVVRIFRDRGNRGGKVVTVVRGLRARGDALEALAAELKRLCGAGGTVADDGAVEIQGDHRERIAEWLRARGHRVKLAGG